MCTGLPRVPTGRSLLLTAVLTYKDRPGADVDAESLLTEIAGDGIRPVAASLTRDGDDEEPFDDMVLPACGPAERVTRT